MARSEREGRALKAAALIAQVGRQLERIGADPSDPRVLAWLRRLTADDWALIALAAEVNAPSETTVGLVLDSIAAGEIRLARRAIRAYHDDHVKA